jgi:hypothetical protein
VAVAHRQIPPTRRVSVVALRLLATFREVLPDLGATASVFDVVEVICGRLFVLGVWFGCRV